MDQVGEGRVSDEDKQLWARLRLAMVATLVMCSLLFGAGYFAFDRIVQANNSSVEQVARIERMRLIADRLADEAATLQTASSPAHGMLAQERFASALGEFARTAALVISTTLRVGDPAQVALLRRQPHGLAAMLEEAHALAVTAGETRDPAAARDARRASRKLSRLVGRRIDRGLSDLIQLKKTYLASLADRVSLMAKAVAGIALATFLIIWRLALRPILSTVAERTHALMAAKDDVERALLFDGLTGLPNRRNLLARLETLEIDAPLGVLHIDLVGLHAINTTLGWETGERLVSFAADNLGEIGLSEDLVARVNADAFVLAIPRAVDAEGLQDLAVTVIEQVGRPIEVFGTTVRLEVVIGIAARQGRVEPAAKLLANADIARSRAREEGGSVYFSTDMRQRLAARRQTAQELMQAIVAGEIEPHFQPQIDAKTGIITGVEALVRWRHPQRGLLNPLFFLEIAEKAHIDGRIGDIMLRRSLEALADWRAAGLPIPRLSLNFTAHALRNPDLCAQLMFALDRHDLSPADLSVEVLESALILDDDDPVMKTIEVLAAAGFHIEIDDFGTGHAALSCLRHQTVSRLKIDRSFVRDLHLRPRIRQMTEAMIQLAHTLEIEALAEGVETQSEWRLLRELGCDGLQGFGIGKPMAASDLPPWVEQHERRRTKGGFLPRAANG
ncbi:MAG: bifunctional diguanylate cyclase/phosphodiesterase [Pseudomonadota bacterium]